MIVATFSLSLQGCDNSDPEETPMPSISGSWAGSANDGLQTYTLSFVIRMQGESAFVADGELEINGTTPSESLGFVAEGIYNFPEVSLAIFTGDGDTFTYSGTINEEASSISGILSNADNLALNLNLTR